MPRLLLLVLLAGTLVGACASDEPEEQGVCGDWPLITTTTSAPAMGNAPSLPADLDGDGSVHAILWGDSLAFEARDEFLQEIGRHPEIRAEARTCGGTAICDFTDDYAGRAADVEVALLLFSGNSAWTCMLEPRADLPPDADEVSRYEADLRDAVAVLGARGAEVVIVGAPDIGFEDSDGVRHRIKAMYRDVAAELDGVTFADAGAVLHEAGGYAQTLPCLSFEDASLGCQPDGRILVRSPDQLHLCPNDHPPDPLLGRCDVWSSGAYRYGRAIADATAEIAGVDPT